MRDPAHQRVVDALTDLLLYHGCRIIEATNCGPLETADEIGELIGDLECLRSILAAVRSADCGDSGCPIHGTAARRDRTAAN